MPLAPLILAVVFGLLVSAALHFVLVWPADEPSEESPDESSDAPAALDPAARD